MFSSRHGESAAQKRQRPELLSQQQLQQQAALLSGNDIGVLPLPFAELSDGTELPSLAVADLSSLRFADGNLSDAFFQVFETDPIFFYQEAAARNNAANNDECFSFLREEQDEGGQFYPNETVNHIDDMPPLRDEHSPNFHGQRLPSLPTLHDQQKFTGNVFTSPTVESMFGNAIQQCPEHVTSVAAPTETDRPSDLHMKRTVAGVENLEMSLFEALRAGGFNYPFGGSASIMSGETLTLDQFCAHLGRLAQKQHEGSISEGGRGGGGGGGDHRNQNGIKNTPMTATSQNPVSIPTHLTDMTKLPDSFEPGPKDVMCYTGPKKAAYDNKHFQGLIQSHLEEYANCSTKKQKSAVITEVVDAIHRGSPEGGFVRRFNGVYYKVGTVVARERVGASFRELLPALYKSANASKRNKKRKTPPCELLQPSAPSNCKPRLGESDF